MILFVIITVWVMTSCCKDEDSYADISYTLICSDDLLEYATPEVTYSSNGTVNTFSISEGEWEETSNSGYSSTTELIIGNETYTKPKKIMTWTKKVHYDKFTTIDDDISVRYIPKTSIPTGKVFMANFVHQITATLSYRDDDGNVYNPVLIDQNVNIPIDLTGNSTLSDIIGKFTDYYGFHVESNGKFSKK